MRHAGLGGQRGPRADVAGRMRALAPVPGTPLAVDLLLDANVTLPEGVCRDAETAATILTRLCPNPAGIPAWREYGERFHRRYGAGVLVPVTELVDPVVGLGYPAGFSDDRLPSRQDRTNRDERLLAYAQVAAIEGRTEIVLTDAMLLELTAGDSTAQARVPPHLEMAVQVLAPSMTAITRGQFTTRVLGVSRAAGTYTGRFLHLLDSGDRVRMSGVYAGLPTLDAAATPVQLSFSPLRNRADHVTRAPLILSSVISLGEYPAPHGERIPLKDLALACDDDQRLYLASISTGRVMEALAPIALNLCTAAHAPPLARFLSEVSRASAPPVTTFDWGAAASLPFLPAVRYGRIVLCAARWLLASAELPSIAASDATWTDELRSWRRRRRVPARVLLAEGDQHLLLDLSQAAHLDLLRGHLSRARRATLLEATSPRDNGWIGGRAHSLVVPLAAADRPPQVVTRRAAVLHRPDANLPGASRWLSAELIVRPDLQNLILAKHLPRLLACFASEPCWWFERLIAPEARLRLVISLPDAYDFGSASGAVGTWASDLHEQRLLSDLRFTAYCPQEGAWGAGAALAAAQMVSHADSKVVAAQFAGPVTVSTQGLTAANLAAIAAGFTGSPALGMRWLVRHARTTALAVARELHSEAVRVANPSGDFAILRAALGSSPAAEALLATWRARHRALASLGALLAERTGTSSDAALRAVLHSHAVRALGTDPEQERIGLHLARAAALAYTYAGGDDDR